MTLDELKAISDACKTDAEFLEHVDVRRVYWRALGHEGLWEHDWGADACKKCLLQKEYVDFYERGVSVCNSPDPISGSLADAAEALRAKVAEEYNEERGYCRGYMPVAAAVNKTIRKFHRLAYLRDTALDRFFVFVEALGAVDMAEAEKVTT